MGDKERYQQFYQPKADFTRQVRIALVSLVALAGLVGLYLLAVPSETKSSSRTYKNLADSGRGLHLDADLARLDLQPGAGDPRTDDRGWMVDPREAARQAGLQGAAVCEDVHLGIILPGKTRGNHRHHTKNETFILWGARTKWRVENPESEHGYVEVVLERDDVVVTVGRASIAHAVINIDTQLFTNLVSCTDGLFDPKHPDTDYKVWKDLNH
eukprot:TRINITY_DN12488_c0_g1_i2.p1 TRINITY_DN12488_c0_g1~~TRINITY_DN12488_c0_g1_i2.p1  ORF type:complete len:241 (-),score=1.84 TRINITY_DN12488_c0_g1_i2:390-1028(-)